MLRRHLTGPSAGAMKYDLLTALGAFALSSDKHTQRRILRLMTLITARYNWAQDEVTVGRTEMARLWGVTERQVKRELGMLKASGFLELKRAGTRGRVSAYRLGITAIFKNTATAWSNVGLDYAERMECHTASDRESQVTASSRHGRVIPFPSGSSEVGLPERNLGDAASAVEGEGALTEWTCIRHVLEQTNQAIFIAWFAPLKQESFADGRLVLRAPTVFHADYVSTRLSEALKRAAAKAAPEVHHMEVIA